MFRVKSMMKLKNGMPVLVCDVFQDSDVTGTLSTDIGVFEKNEFEVGQLRHCFSEPTSRTIMIRTEKDCSKIRVIEFI